MRDVKMAELQFEAPLANFDGDEWNEFHDFQTTADIENFNKISNMDTENTGPPNIDNFNEFNDVNFSGSLEDLVNTFDEKITKCFRNYEENVENFAPVQVRTQEEIMTDCQMWWTITGNFGNILPIDWSKSYARQLHTKSLKLGEKRECVSPELDLSDDEELQQAFDMHSLIINSLHQEPLFTAEQVINEIEGMMEEDMASESCSTATGSDLLSAAEAELLHFNDGQTCLPLTYEESEFAKQGLENLSLTALNELYEELEITIKEFSETLIHQLALRDELEYEKELKNQFISLLLSIQKKRRETQVDKKRNPAVMKRQRGSGALEPGTYLTTVIPYHANHGPPSIDQLQIYIKILTAINSDSSTVPGLLTDYILKVLCPTT